MLEISYLKYRRGNITVVWLCRSFFASLSHLSIQVVVWLAVVGVDDSAAVAMHDA